MRAASLLSRSGALLIALALAVRVLVPQGFMLMAAAGGGAPAMVMCTGQGAMAMAPAKHEPRDRKAGDSCPFAVAGLALDTGADAAVDLAPAGFGFVPIDRPAIAAPGRGLAAPPPPSTGPPAFA